MPWGGVGGQNIKTASYSSDFELARHNSGELHCPATALIISTLADVNMLEILRKPLVPACQNLHYGNLA